MNYVENEELLEEIKKFKENGVASERLGEMILLIAEHYASIGSFSNYTWKEDMIAEAALTCIKYLRNFQPKKSKNAFSYISQVCKNSYRAYIKNQNKHGKIKDVCYRAYSQVIKESMFTTTSSYSRIDYTKIKDE